MSITAAAATIEATVAIGPEGGEERIEGRSTWQLAWARFKRDKAALISLGIIIFIILCAIFAPVFADITGHGVNQQFRHAPGPIGLTPDGLPVGLGHGFALGTDDQGRDILVRIAYGARISLFIGVVVTLMVVAIGAVLGLAAGYLGGIVDTLIARLIDVVLSLPYLIFAVSLVSIGFLGGPGISIIIFVIAVFSWAAIARVVRGQVLSIREKEYIEAARSLGAGSWRIMFVDILPNVVAQLIVYATLLIPVVIIFEAALSFLGLGIPPPTADWGQMISEAQGVYQQAWWFLVFPSLALVVTTVAFNVFGDGIRDALDPRLDRL